MKLSIITLNFRQPALTLVCLASVYKKYKTQFDNDEYECIIVDNFSEDHSVALIKKEIAAQKYKNVHVIENTKNTGFGAGNNLGAHHAKGEILLFLNNDTVVQKGIKEMLLYLQDHQEVAILGGPLKNMDDSPQPSIGTFYTVVDTLRLLLGLQRVGLIDKNPTHIKQVDWVKGALLMIRKEVFDQLKGFDEHIFMYTEDMELCYRAHLKGYNTFFYPAVQVYHKEQGSSNRTFAIVHIYKNLLYFYSKHRNSVEYSIVKAALVTKAIIAIILGTILGKRYLVETYSRALKGIS